MKQINPLGSATIYPQAFSSHHSSAADAGIAKLIEFFEKKGLAAIKEEDQREQWYEDWLAYQAKHGLYAGLLCPGQYSTTGGEFDLLKMARFLEVFAYFSPAHGYSLQVTFLGFFCILMGDNAALKQEAAATLQAGGLLGFGVSEKSHGADLLGNEFTVREIASEKFLANGSKYYIGNANAASMISILSRQESNRAAGKSSRAPMLLFALRPKQSKSFTSVRKIRTLGVRAGFVGEFQVNDHELPQSDLIARNRRAWDAVLGTVSLGKFFLGFGSIGICEHAWREAVEHLSNRILFNKPVIEMPHIRSLMAQAYSRLTAMKLYAYRALDYVHAAGADDRRYLLFAAVQKAMVSTEGVKVMALLSQCVGAKGFEADTYFEMALRDIQLIPGLESSMHINLGQTTQFIPQYFATGKSDLPNPKSLFAGEEQARENSYLMDARVGAVNDIAFPDFLDAYQPLLSIRNVRNFARQAKAFHLFIQEGELSRSFMADLEVSMALGHCQALIAYGQLIAENAVRLNVPAQMVSAIFQLLVGDMSVSAMQLAGLPDLGKSGRSLSRKMVAIPRSAAADWKFVWEQFIPASTTPQAPPAPAGGP